MDFNLTQTQEALRQEVRTFAERVLSPGARARELEHRFARSLWDAAAAHGLAGLPIPAEWGGRGLDALDVVLAVEALGQGCEDGGLTFSLCAHTFACAV